MDPNICIFKILQTLKESEECPEHEPSPFISSQREIVWNSETIKTLLSEGCVYLSLDPWFPNGAGNEYLQIPERHPRDSKLLSLGAAETCIFINTLAVLISQLCETLT